TAQGDTTPTLEEPVRTVSVSGTGEVSAAPDQATIQIGVRTEAETAEQALAENNERMSALVDTLRAAGIQSRDIQTTNFAIWPQYRHRDNEAPDITGYEVSNTVSITVRNLDTFGETLDAAIRAGGNQVNNIQFDFSDPAALMDQARQNAMADARHRASQLAQLAEVQLGPVVTISESGTTPPPVIMREMPAVEADVAAVPIERGESTISINLQVTYELLP
ncbi:MAG: SIMPL domain-containing protein, partial [Chloroflexota bacterium]|nr:SIMPL domain-containing protein [Chloroflexota bacterium]